MIPLIDLLNAYNPSDVEEISAKESMLTLVQQSGDAFERWHLPAHFTASAWVINTKQQVLLLHHAKLQIWVQPGGHCDGEKDVMAVAIKEAQEESGLVNLIPLCAGIFDLDIHEIPATAAMPAHFHYDIRFLLQATGDEPLHNNHESLEIAWVSWHDIKRYSDSWSLERMNRKCQKMFNDRTSTAVAPLEDAFRL